MALSNLLLTAGIAIGAIGGYVIWRKISTSIGVGFDEETVDGEVAFDDLIAYFKSLHLKREDGDCYIISEKHDSDNQNFDKLLNFHKDGYTSLALLVYDARKCKFTKIKIVHARNFDKKTFDTLGNNGLIKLT